MSLKCVKKYKTKTQKNVQHNNNINTSKILFGGKYIDKGSFGCVVKPAIKCYKRDSNTQLKQSISKIIHDSGDDGDTSLDELKMSTILKKLDPEQHYYLTYIKFCYINDIPVDRKDITNAHKKKDNNKNNIIHKQSSNSNHRNKHKHVCKIDLTLKPLNIIMDYGGYSLYNIIKYNITNTHINTHTKNGLKVLMHKLFIKNLKENFKHLLLGIVKMHNNRIVNRDIKPKNILMKLNTEHTAAYIDTHIDNNDKDTNPNTNPNTNPIYTILLRYIDFGLSEILTSLHCSDIDNISINGTRHYISPELYITYIYHKYNTNNTEEYIIKKINTEIHNNVYKAFNIINELSMISDLDNKNKQLYDTIKNLYNTKKILPYYFGTTKHKFNGYLQKNDVYALGLTMFELLYIYSDYNMTENLELYDLLKHMIAFDPYIRYNAVQCINHAYFTG